jgi:DNA-binding response OmpR family regulator
MLSDISFLKEARILLVDDSRDQLQPLIDALREGGSRIVFASNGPQAYQRALAVSPNLIAMDVRLQPMDGLTVCRVLTADPRTRAIPVMFLTAANDRGQRIGAFEAGAVDYVLKPFELDEVLARMRVHLTRADHEPSAAESADSSGFRDDGTLVRAALEHVLDVPDDLPTLDELARHVGTDTAHLSRAFRNSVGQTAHQYLLEVRLRAGQRLLASTALSVGRIADKTGLQRNAFTAAFRERFGISPSEYRFQSRLELGSYCHKSRDP